VSLAPYISRAEPAAQYHRLPALNPLLQLGGGLSWHWQEQWSRKGIWAEHAQHAPLQPQALVRKTNCPGGQRACAVLIHTLISDTRASRAASAANTASPNGVSAIGVSPDIELPEPASTARVPHRQSATKMMAANLP
jgi:hypothetical protein